MDWFIDAGNTAVRLVRFAADGSVAARVACPTGRANSAALARAMETLEIDRPAGGDEPTAWIASVVPVLRNALRNAAIVHGRRPYFVSPLDPELGPHALSTPATTGVDRRLAAFAAWTDARDEARHGKGAVPRAGLLVIQAGTAAAVDWIDRFGRFRGGLILPGPDLWRAGLGRAAQLPAPAAGSGQLALAGTVEDDASFSGAVDWEAGAAPLGDGTAPALSGGLATGLSGAVWNAARALGAQAARLAAAEDDAEDDAEDGDGTAAARGAEGWPALVLTGGWADGLLTAWRGIAVREGLAAVFPSPFRRAPDLVLHGLRHLAARRRGE